MEQDFVMGGNATGLVANRLMANNFNTGALRPFVGDDNRTAFITNEKGVAVPVHNATATLRKDEWTRLDEAVVKAAKPRLRAVADLRSAGLEYGIPNGLGTTVLQTETMSDITAATISMDGLRKSEGDRPLYELTNLPLPIIHKDFNFSARQIATSRNMGSPLDTSTAELAARRVAEEVEKLLLGVSSTYAFGGGTIYGYTNLSGRMTASLTDPDATAWTPATLLSEVLAMKVACQAQYHYGPWMLYFSPNWDQFLDDDYNSTGASVITLRNRLAQIDGIMGVRTLDYLTTDTCLLVQMTADVARMVVGMEIQTVQWETEGGMNLNFKVMCMLTPQLRKDQNGNGGIVHASVA